MRPKPLVKLQASFTADNTLVLTNASSTAQFYGKGESFSSPH